MPSTSRVAAAQTVASLFVVAFIYVALSARQPAPGLPASFAVSGHSFDFSAYAVTQQQQEQGLMNQTVTNGTFMLFVFSKPSIYRFWMYDTYDALDIIWLNGTRDGATVVYVAANAQPCVNAPQQDCAVYAPDAAANYVIEAKAGFAPAYGIGVGTRVSFAR